MKNSRRTPGECSRPAGHLWTSSVAYNGGPRTPMCSWCGRTQDKTMSLTTDRLSQGETR